MIMSVKKRRRILVGLILSVFIAGILVGLGGHFVEQVQHQPVIPETEAPFGDVIVDSAAGEVRFYGEVRQDEGWVRFLVYLSSYRWLEEEAAIVSPASLVDLQMAIARLDWQLWDQLWHRNVTGQEVEVWLEWQGGRAEANDLLQLPYHLGIGDLIFLGSPLFDLFFLARCLQTIACPVLGQRDRCPLFFLQERVEAKFVRASGGVGYQLDGERLPPPGTRVSVIIRVPGLQGGG
jgi:hypothetical protein